MLLLLRGLLRGLRGLRRLLSGLRRLLSGLRRLRRLCGLLLCGLLLLRRLLLRGLLRGLRRRLLRGLCGLLLLRGLRMLWGLRGLLCRLLLRRLRVSAKKSCFLKYLEADMITLTRREVVALGPCSLRRIPVYRGRKALSAGDALEAGVPVEDLLWVASKLGLVRECVQFALACAKEVAHLNLDPRVQAAIDATQAWLDNPTADAAEWAAG